MFCCHSSHILKNLGIQYFTMRDIDRLGIQRVMEMTFDHLLTRSHMDIQHILAILVLNKSPHHFLESKQVTLVFSPCATGSSGPFT